MQWDGCQLGINGMGENAGGDGGIGEYFSSNIKWIPPSHPLKPLVAIPKQDATYILSL